MASSIRSTLKRYPPLELGARGKFVRRLEVLLRRNRVQVTKVDGVFDRSLLARVKRFQRARSLKVDGEVGQQTWAALLGLRRLPTGTNLLREPNAAVRIATGYSGGRPRRVALRSVGDGEFLQKRAAASYLKMVSAARRAGVHLSSTSGFRTHREQAVLYARYGSGRAAPAGYSNHQLGLSMDIGGINGYGTRAYQWLNRNARRFGFVNDVPGEFWHWTYKP